MTVVVSIHCEDGVVLASDSMLTNSLGSIGTTETKGKKIYAMPNDHLFALAGDPALANRFRAVLEHGVMPHLASQSIALDYATTLTGAVISHFGSTGLVSPFNLNTCLAFVHNGQHFCSLFGGDMQPRLLDAHHYWAVLGSGKQYADPFLAFLTNVFCEKQPNTNTGRLLAVWAVEHAIQTNTGGVNGPIQVSVLQRDSDNNYFTKELSDDEIDDQIQAIEAAKGALVDWRNSMSGENADAEESNPPPTAS